MKSMTLSRLTGIAILLIISSFYLFTSSCKSGEGGTPEKAEIGTGDLAGLVMEEIPGSSTKYARQIGANGNLEVEGFVENDKKTGQWIQYSPEGDIILINHYVNGMLEGVALRMGFRNQVDLRVHYKKNRLEGQWVAYKFGKVIEERLYKDDKLDGVAKTYDERTFKLKQEVQYKNGLQHGYFRYYDDEGVVSLEYQYEKGEKISGGIVEKK